jgi:hypothetical protein
VTSEHQWLLTTGTGGGREIASPKGMVCDVGCAGCANDWYINPKVFANLQPYHDDNLKVQPGPYTLDGQTHQAVVIDYTKGQAHYLSFYDQATGILLGFDAKIEGAAGNTQVRHFKGLRQVKLPWLGGGLMGTAPAPTLPDWLANLRHIGGSGTYRGGAAGTFVTFGLKIDHQIVDHGADWLRVDQITTLTYPRPNLPPKVGKQTIAVGPAVLGSLWLPPAGLAALTAGQVLDDDPLVGTHTVCAATGGGLVVLRETGATHTIDLSYDARTGALARMHKEEHGLASFVTDLVLNEAG